MGKQRMAYPGSETYSRFGREKLCCDGADHAHKTQQHQYTAHFPDHRVVGSGDPRIDHGGNDQRYQQFKGRFQQLKKRTENAFFYIWLQKG